MREWAITRFARLGQPGRRGFGGTADAAEAAALRQATRGDHDLNPGWTPPSTELRAAAVLVPLIDRPGGMSAAQQSDQGLLDHLALTKDDFADTFADEA